MSEAAAPAPQEVKLGGRRELDRVILRSGLLVLFALVTLYFAATEPTFRSFDNIVSILQSVSTVGIIALGVTVSMIIGGFDLSIGANAGFTVMLCAICLVLLGLPTVAVVPIALAGGLIIGALNGLLVVRLGVPDLLATLGMLFVLQGAQLLPSRGQSISTGVVLGEQGVHGDLHRRVPVHRARSHRGRDPRADRALRVRRDRARGSCSSAPAGAACSTRSAATPRPRGSRACASTGCGWRPTWSRGGLAALGGIILAARIGEGDVGAGNSYLLDAVAAALVGYAVLAVNRPNVLGTAVGAVFLGIMINGLTIKNFPYYTQDFVKGVVLMVALLLTFGVRRLR